MKKIVAVILGILSILLLVVVAKRIGLINPNSQLASISFAPIASCTPASSCPFAPLAYFSFDGTNVNTSSFGTKQLSKSATANTAPTYITSGTGPVGHYAEFTSTTTSVNPVYITGGTGFTDAFAIETLFRAEPGFNNTSLFNTNDNSVSIYFGVSAPAEQTATNEINIEFDIRTDPSTTTKDEFHINMIQGGVANWDYLADGKWHHLAFVRKTDGTRQVWIDGQLPDGFSYSPTQGATTGPLISTSGTIDSWFSSEVGTSASTHLKGDLDQIALYSTVPSGYDTPLPENLIVQHYQDALLVSPGSPYQFWTPIVSVNVGQSTAFSAFSLDEFAPGLSATDIALAVTPPSSATPLEQLSMSPVARFVRNNTLHSNWIHNLQELADASTPNPTLGTSKVAVINNGIKITDILANHFNVMIPLINLNVNDPAVCPIAPNAQGIITDGKSVEVTSPCYKKYPTLTGELLHYADTQLDLPLGSLSQRGSTSPRKQDGNLTYQNYGPMVDYVGDYTGTPFSNTVSGVTHNYFDGTTLPGDPAFPWQPDHCLKDANGNFLTPNMKAPSTGRFYTPSGAFINPKDNRHYDIVPMCYFNYYSPIADYIPDGRMTSYRINRYLSLYSPNRVAKAENDSSYKFYQKALLIFGDNGELIPVFNGTRLAGDPIFKALADSAIPVGTVNPFLTGNPGTGNNFNKYTDAQRYGLYASRYYAKNYKEAYFDPALSGPGLSNTERWIYAIHGMFPANGGYDWKETRLASINDNDPNMRATPSPDYYPSTATNYTQGSSSRSGFGRFEVGLDYTTKTSAGLNDQWTATWFAPSCSSSLSNNFLPAQQMADAGLLYTLSAKYLLIAHFGTDSDWCAGALQDTSNYTYGFISPLYAQAALSRVQDFYLNSHTIKGDSPIAYNKRTTGYKFSSTNPNDYTYVRQSNSGAKKFLITTASNAYTFQPGSVRDEKVITITLDGKKLSFKTGRKGYMYYADFTGVTPLFYQLDGWHEIAHPSKWTKNIDLEAELMDAGTPTLTTSDVQGTGTTIPFDFSGSVTSVRTSSALEYDFVPRLAYNSTVANPMYMWVSAKSSSPASLNALVDGGTPTTVNVTSNAFTWVKMNGSFSVADNAKHTLKVTPSNNSLELDRIILTPDASFVPPSLSTVDVTAPTDPTNLSSTGQTDLSIDLSWNASSDNVGVVAYDIYNGATLTGTSAVPSYTVSGLTPATPYVFSVKARDLAGNISNASSPVSVSTRQQVDTTAPSVPSNITASNITDSSFTISWDASTDNVGVTGYEVSIDGVVVSVNQTTTSYSAQNVADNTTFIVSVRSRDAVPNWSTASTLSVRTLIAPDTQAPTGSITTPSVGTTLSGTVTITALATDNRSLDHIDFYNGTALIGTSVAVGTSGQFSAVWNTNSGSVANGGATLSAQIFDTTGNSFMTQSIAVVISNIVIPPPDTIAPTVSWNTPADGSVVSGTITLSARAVDNLATQAVGSSGVSRVNFYRSTRFLGADTSADANGNYEIAYDFINSTTGGPIQNGIYSMLVQACDASPSPVGGNCSAKVQITVTLNNPVADTTKPVVSIVTPMSNATVDGIVTIKATVTDNVGVAQVKFYNDGVYIGDGVNTSGSTYALSTWNTTGLSNGITTLYAVATDTSGNFQQSTDQTVTVDNADHTPPTTVTGLTVTAITATSMTLNWNASSDNIAVAGYDIAKGTTLLASNAPGTSYNVSGLIPNTSYTFSVTARDTSNNASQSTSITVSTIALPPPDNTPPMVSITYPANNQHVQKGSVVHITANATDNVGVDHVDFKINTFVVHTDTTAPYSYDWTVPVTITNKNYQINANAYDVEGNKGYSPTNYHAKAVN